jgi:hypothetical protein
MLNQESCVRELEAYQAICVGLMMKLQYLALLLATACARQQPLFPASSLAPTPLAARGARGAAAPAASRGGEIAGTMSDTAAIVSLFKTIVGGGILALPAGMAAGKGTGVAPGLAILALHAAVSAYTYLRRSL